MKKILTTILSIFCLLMPATNARAQGIAHEIVTVPAPVIPGQPTVTVISLGAEPRQELRYRFSGNAELITMELNMEMGIELDGRTIPKQKMPTFVQTVQIIPTSINGGNMSYQYIVSKINILPSAGVDPNVMKTLQGLTQGLVGQSGTGQITSRGGSTVGNMQPPDAANPMMVEQVNGLNDRMSRVASPLPLEAVGVGAQWKIEMPMFTNGILMTGVHTFEILSIQGDIVKVSVKAAVEAQKQLAEIPNLPAGVRAVVESVKASCEGTNEFDLKLFCPVSTLDLKLDQEAAVIQPGQPDQKMTMSMDMQLRIKPTDLETGVVGSAEVIQGDFVVPTQQQVPLIGSP